ncbi:threonine--tRNA ligase [Streptomyces netropsis]|uniref:Threonine--tRNA ligase n=2 Tax=Streptomyces netropsis TaxID=55404 RepID=A0A7W7PG33_STRNE|nr:threonine--tRNA ligase [Streptomyces netropsis]MBB4887330.1 threonyl-tRNA synthetase [Streptomyces netropsis]GGR09515.1 threonine--tRNA ligase [Streptomyces netropsis]
MSASRPADETKRAVVVPAGTTCADAVAAAKLPMNGPNAIVVVRDPEGTLRDLDWVPDAEVEVEAVALSSPDGLDVLRHSTAHVLAQAVQQEWPEARLGIGPPIENGFYYDFDVERPFQPEDLERVEQRMKDIIKSGQRFRRREFPSLDDARTELATEPYKLELVDLKGDVDTSEIMEVGSGDLTIYDNVDAKTGDVCWSDLCRGPHLPSTRLIPAFKLMRSAAAYWRGSEKNPQLQRIYGTAWPTRDALKSHLKALEEAAKRDHRRIGEDLDMFAFSKEIGRGLPLWLPNGTIVRDELEGWARRSERKLGYQRVVTPHITQEDLYYLSGHLPYYAEDLYAPIEIDGEKYYLKPMNCPHHHMVYKARPHSYRDLPYKIAEYGTVYRFERSGQLHGTMRTRGFTQNDAHIYCTQEQAKDQFLEVMRMHADYYRTLGITDFYMVLALRDPANREKYHDDEVMWETAERITREAMEESDIPFEIDRGGAAHYGPKVDFMIRAVTGKEFAASTNQVDLYTPQRFGLTYHDSDGTEKPVVVIHRAPLGSQERFTAYLTEHFAGAFPVWLAPEQVRVIPIVDELTDYANEVRDLLLDADVRADVDAGDGRLNAKIRTAVTRKIPLIVVVGRREAEERSVTVRDRSGKETPMPLDAFVGHVTELIRTKSLDGAGHLRPETDGGNA